MFHHVKDLQFNARVSKPDPKFASILLEQFGGGNGELKAAMQYFVQSFGIRQAYPKHYDLLMDIATEEFSHLEIVGATITMLLDGLNGELKDISERSGLMKLLDGKGPKEEMIQDAFVNPQFFALSGGGPRVTDSQGVPWQGSYVNSNGDLTVDLRSNMAAESRAKIVYEYLLQFTDDPYVRESLQFLMTREIAHYEMFAAALETIQPNFPPGILQGEQRFSNMYFNMSDGGDVRGPWNSGPQPITTSGKWVYVEDPVQQVRQTQGQTTTVAQDASMTQDAADAAAKQLSRQRTSEVKSNVPDGVNQWSRYSQTGMAGEDGTLTQK